jgi:hypothetical protein
MRRTIALNASFFNTHRMLQEYVIHAYREQNALPGGQPRMGGHVDHPQKRGET